jgi:hypothetical protein
MVEMTSVGILHCLSECRFIVYCAFTGVSLNLVKSVCCIYRHAEHTEFVSAGSRNMYILHLQAHSTCIFAFTGH